MPGARLSSFSSTSLYPERFHLTNTHKSIGNHHNSDSNESDCVRYVRIFDLREWLVWFGITFGVRESQKESATRGTRLDAESKKGHADMRIPLPWLTFPCRHRSVRLSVMRRTCSLLFQHSVHALKVSQPNNMTNVDIYWNLNLTTFLMVRLICWRLYLRLINIF